MDRSMPLIPEEFITRLDHFDRECYFLWNDVLRELENADFTQRSHHNTGTHDKGCRGPLCRKAYREHPRRKTPTGFSGYTPREERVYDPILEFFHTVAKFRIKNYQQEVFKELTK